MRILTWNIRHGGMKYLPQICATIQSHDPDVIVLIEYRASTSKKLPNLLTYAGWGYQCSSEPTGTDNGVFIASRSLLVLREHHKHAPEVRERWLEVEIPAASLALATIHIPVSSNTKKMCKAEYWDAVIKMAEVRASEPHLFIGDYNTGKHYIDEDGATFKCAEYLDKLEALGWTEAWRMLHPDSKEFTWYSNAGNGFRLDMAYASPLLRPRIKAVEYSHTEREKGISDHSLLVIKLED